MILKSLSRKEPTFAQLLTYIQKEAIPLNHLGEEFKEIAHQKFLEISEAYDYLKGHCK